jgi:RNA recognition motif. (a.k.a. RRM, RBD, or RNP domain)
LLLVHHFRISGPENKSSLIQCNCPSYFNIDNHDEDLSHASQHFLYGMSQYLESVNIDEITSQISQLTVSQSYVTQPQYTQMVTGYAVPMTTSPVTSAQLAALYTSEAYQTNEDGLPVNTTHGTVRSVRLAVHIANLPRKTTKKELVALLKRKRVAPPLHVELNTDPDSGKFRGVAIVHFDSAEDVRQAIKALDNYSWDGRPLRVKRARESVPMDEGNASPKKPLVVNGSTNY